MLYLCLFFVCVSILGLDLIRFDSIWFGLNLRLNLQFQARINFERNYFFISSSFSSLSFFPGCCC